MNDSRIIQNLIDQRGTDGVVMIPKRSMMMPGRDEWILDEAILLPSHTTLILNDCVLQLSDQCRDNFIRSANCGCGMEVIEKATEIHIRGEGKSALIGAEKPRSTGDSSKILVTPCPFTDEDLIRLADWIPPERKASGKLISKDRHSRSYGTDAGKSGEIPTGDWRNVGILLANVEHFSIENISIINAHSWGISLEACGYGQISKIEFNAQMSRRIDGLLQNIQNQDGIDLRNGCHHITIQEIRGQIGDDVLALTAIANPEEYRPAGTLGHGHIMNNDWDAREPGIRDITISDISAYSNYCWSVRLLAIGKAVIENVCIDHVSDLSYQDQPPRRSGILIGESDGIYGTVAPGSIRKIRISNVISSGSDCIKIRSYLKDSTIKNVRYAADSKKDPYILERPECLENVELI